MPLIFLFLFNDCVYIGYFNGSFIATKIYRNAYWGRFHIAINFKCSLTMFILSALD